ncbi:MAG: hypothetical protein L0H73_12545 [Nitrococcus sp.]|nr:hypothetical protein [Nitrococcus sp.]
MRASRAENQRRFRAKTDKQRIEVYLAPEVVAALDAMAGTRAQAITDLVAQATTGSTPRRDQAEATTGSSPSQDWVEPTFASGPYRGPVEPVQSTTGSREPICSTAQMVAATKPPRRTFLLDDGTAITVNAIKTANGNYRYTFMVNGRRISRANLERKLAQ